MEGELWKLREEDEDTPAPGAGRARRRVLVSLVGLVGLLLICGGAGVLVVRAKSSRNAVAARGGGQPQLPGLRLVDKKILFATGVLQPVDLRLPCSGRLSINLTFPEGTSLSVFLMPPEERAKMEAGQAFTHVDGFDAKTASGSYHHAAHLPAGRYCLFLLDESGSRGVVEVSAHLGELK